MGARSGCEMGTEWSLFRSSGSARTAEESWKGAEAMPMERARYPRDWEAIALQVKEEAGWKCEVCGKQCRRPGEPFDTHRRTLTVAHLDHTPENCTRENLKAMCAPCHLRYDARQHAESRRRHRMEDGRDESTD